MTLDIHRHPEAAAQRPSKDGRPQPGRRPPISGLPEIGTIARKSATADLRWLASRAPQGDGNESALYQVPRSRSGSRPLALKMGTLVGAESNRISAAAASFSVAPENRPALKVVTPWMSGGSGPTM